ncbi:MAG: hypothetical protein N2327_03110 [Caldimicrobium sp.]|nr:hypothetical protein [Caldimicrobium sp.]MDW8094389.1 hypothetical protein [Caldimicrobium sp.]
MKKLSYYGKTGRFIEREKDVASRFGFAFEEQSFIEQEWERLLE